MKSKNKKKKKPTRLFLCENKLTLLVEENVQLRIKVETAEGRLYKLESMVRNFGIREEGATAPHFSLVWQIMSRLKALQEYLHIDAYPIEIPDPSMGPPEPPRTLPAYTYKPRRPLFNKIKAYVKKLQTS